MSKNNDNQYGAGHLAFAFLGGAAAGAAVALLTAPKSGRETRKQLRGYAESGVDKGRQLPEAVKAASGAAREAFSESMSAKGR
jgi:gas vesicle protein